MSRCHYAQPAYTPMPMPAKPVTGGYSFALLIILILIVLQFNRRGRGCDDDGGYRDGNILDNSILFIIAFFFLVCGCGCGRGFGGGYGAY